MKSIHASLTYPHQHGHKGVLLPDAKIIETVQALMINQVSPPTYKKFSKIDIFQTPPIWDQLWPGSADPISYLEALVYKSKATHAESRNIGSPLIGLVNLFNLFRSGADNSSPFLHAPSVYIEWVEMVSTNRCFS